MAGVWKRDGTVAVTNGNKKVTGTGTTFADTKNGVAKGHLFCITSGTSVDFYEVDYVVSNTELYLVQAYRGVTATGKAYEIITTFSDSVPEFARRLTATLSAYQQQSDAFQALLTSTATTVEVTAPDGTKQTLIPWKRVTSEGEGQAARAKTEADKAAASAALAGDIVAASALPLPDVWAPLSDSLRLITGYGRDVLVGSDVVARMVNFSRSTTATYIGKDGQLKTAAANEPRFEKEGLLVEGQSTNLTLRSEDWDFFNHVTGGTTVKTATEQNPYGASSQIKSAVCAKENSNVSLVGAPQDMTGVKSLSVFFNIKVAPSGFYVYVASSSDKVTISPAGEISSVASGLTATVKPVGGAGWRRLTISSGIAVSRFSFNLPNVSDEIAFWGVQTEALPFASSYIPTNGAAVTRAKDILYLAPSGNVPSDINMTFAAQIKLMGKGLNSWPRVFEPSDVANKGAFIDMSTGLWGGANLVGVRKTVAARFSDTSRWLDGVNIGSVWQPYPVKTYSEPVYIAGSNVAGSRDFYGHIRNLRAWFFSPTDDQMKAIR
ncbi:hypothetical protein [Aeromonas sp. PrichA-15]|uniref:phage head spike fiber domain-containing protein n=1 Tax=Aeromonas sp. PrichA-15 TaxID=2823360 RepID=UPI001B32CD70|nr:hypothetical protein [Aeromonas sp. PrichA-15]MBP4034349.1 hypothetical protein [Aeromonas sp. PrichA-15]